MIKDLQLFFGVVERLDDPLQQGRAGVRIFGIHTANKSMIPTDKLLWAKILIPAIYPSISGIGASPVGLVNGATVAGFFTDTDYQEPWIAFTFHGVGVPELPNTQSGFSDPDGVYPLEANVSDVNRLAINNEIDKTIVAIKNESRVIDIPTSNDNTWSEPESPYSAQYPFNMVTESRSGHINEVDDTPENERLHEYHRSGTYTEIDNKGDKVTKVVGDDYEITIGNKNVLVKGEINITVEGNANLYVQGNVNQKIDGDIESVVKGNKTETVEQNYTLNVIGDSVTNIDGSLDESIGGNTTQTTSGNTTINATRIDLN